MFIFIQYIHVYNVADTEIKKKYVMHNLIKFIVALWYWREKRREKIKGGKGLTLHICRKKNRLMKMKKNIRTYVFIISNQ